MRDNEKMAVKPGLEKQYAEYVIKNQDGYGNAAVMAGAVVAVALDAGKTPEEAQKAMYGHGLTGFLAGCAASAVAYYHPRGDEFRQWWNKYTQINDEGDKANESGGILNPALLSFESHEP